MNQVSHQLKEDEASIRFFIRQLLPNSFSVFNSSHNAPKMEY